MMSILRKLAKPLAVLYGGVTTVRNVLYDKKVLKSTAFDLPIINVGNLSVGGTGKTPHIEYLIRLLAKKYRVATLSRGYKRQSSGFVLANEKTTVLDIGDEPYQYAQKFKNILVAVDEKRVHGVAELLKLDNKPEVILLDDAFQHRKIEAGLNIVLTPYDDLFVDDTMLPTGNLRERAVGISRAQLIIVSKCPETLTEEEQFALAQRLPLSLTQTVYFSKIQYDDFVYNKTLEKRTLNSLKGQKVTLVTGISNPKPLLTYLEKNKIVINHIAFSDHHNFSSQDISVILEADDSLIITTEKDFMRLQDKIKTNLYYLPIKIAIINNEEDFNLRIKNYVEQSTENR
jgi:tetraacyldisaccharide 4'-kinase